MSGRNFADVEITGDPAHPMLVRACFRTCAGGRTRRFKGGGAPEARLHEPLCSDPSYPCKAVAHDRMHDELGGIVWRHRNTAAKHLDFTAVPKLFDGMKRAKAGINEVAQVLSNRFASVPIADAKVSDRIFGVAVQTAAKRLIVDLFQKASSQWGHWSF